jgi:hypothetical protein
MKKEAQFKADMLMRGADIDMRLRGDILKTSDIQTIGTVLQTGGQLALAGSR